MKKNSTHVLTKNNAMRIIPSWRYLEYRGIENGTYIFFFDDCKISISLDRAKHMEINKYIFGVGESSEDSITLRYLGLKKPGRNTYKG